MRTDDVWTIFGWLFLTGCVFIMIGIALLPLLERSYLKDEEERRRKDEEARK